jgi:dTDP-4-dehydrorhamnose reductase
MCADRAGSAATPVRVLVTGADGQLGRQLRGTQPAGIAACYLGRRALDIGERAQCDAAMATHLPQLVINAAAYTDVEKAEDEASLAQRVNADGAGNIAAAAQSAGARVVQVSTDYVFDGRAHLPYPVDAPLNPLSVYGRSKADGEARVLAATGGRALVVRTAWLYAAGGRNFVSTMLRLMQQRDELRVVADQLGTPTWARGLAQALWRFAARPELHGVFHWTDAGVASWYDFAVAIGEEAAALGVIKPGCRVIPIATADYPTRAVRPSYSVLDKSRSWQTLGEIAGHWRESLRSMLSATQGRQTPGSAAG